MADMCVRVRCNRSWGGGHRCLGPAGEAGKEAGYGGRRPYFRTYVVRTEVGLRTEHDGTMLPGARGVELSSGDGGGGGGGGGGAPGQVGIVDDGDPWSSTCFNRRLRQAQVEPQVRRMARTLASHQCALPPLPPSSRSNRSEGRRGGGGAAGGGLGPLAA